MDVALGVLATVLSLVFAVILLDRYRGRRRLYYLAWGASMLFFAIGSGAMAWGVAFGWTPASFRLYYLAGAMLTVPWLALGSIALLWGRRTGEVAFAVVAVYTLAAVAVMALNGLRHAVSPTAFPKGKEYFPFLGPRLFAVVGQALGAVIVAGGAAFSAWRALRERGNGPLFQGNVLIVLGVLLLSVEGSLLGLGVAASKAAALALGSALLFAGFLRASVRPRDREPTTVS